MIPHRDIATLRDRAFRHEVLNDHATIGTGAEIETITAVTTTLGPATVIRDNLDLTTKIPIATIAEGFATMTTLISQLRILLTTATRTAIATEVENGITDVIRIAAIQLARNREDIADLRIAQEVRTGAGLTGL